MNSKCSLAPVLSDDHSLVCFVTGNDLGHFVEVHAVRDGKLLSRFAIGPYPTSLALSPDGRSVVVGKDEPWSLTWWDWRRKSKTASAVAGRRFGSVSSLVFSPDGTLLGSHYQFPRPGQACLWDVRSGRLVSAQEGGGDYARVKFAPDGRNLSLIPYNGQTRVPVFGKSSDYERLSPDGTRAVVASRNTGPDDEDEFLSVFDVATKTLLWKRKSGKGTTINGMEIAPDGKTIATSQPNERGDSPANFSLWDTATGQVRHVLDAKGGSYRFAFSGDGRSIAALDMSSTLHIWDVWTGQLKKTMVTPTGYVAELALSPGGTRLVSADIHGSLSLYDVRSGELLLRWLALVSPDGGQSDWIAVTPTGFYLASPGAERLIRWRVGAQLFPAQTYRSPLLRPDIIRQILAG